MKILITERQFKLLETTSCRSENTITAGMIDSIMNNVLLLKDRDLGNDEVKGAIDDFKENYLNEFNKIFGIKNKKKKNHSEMKEQDMPSPGGSSGGGSPSVPKWEDVVGGPLRGKANPLMKKGEDWSSGINRGVANQIW